MSDSSQTSAYGWDIGLPDSPLQRRLSVNSAYDYDGIVGGASDKPTATSLHNGIGGSQPTLSTKQKSSLQAPLYSAFASTRQGWEDDDDVYGLGARYHRTPLTQQKATPEAPLPQLNSRREVGDLSRAFFAYMNKDFPEAHVAPTDGLAVMYQRPMRRPSPLCAKDSVRIRNEARELANADPVSTGGFYDIASEVAPSSRSVPTAPAESKPSMRSAEVSWDSIPEMVAEEAEKKANEAGSEEDLMVELYTDNVIQAVVAVVEDDPASSSTQSQPGAVVSDEPVPGALTQRPAALDPTRIYTGVPTLAPTPVLRREEPVPSGKKNSVRSTASGATSSAEAFEADEVLRVSYASGEVQQSGVLDMLRVHFLSGHNALVAVTCTQRCNALAEDCVATTISTVFNQATSMGPQFTNEFALSGYALLPGEKVSNLLPTVEQDAEPETIGLAANPISGTVIHNYRPVRVGNEGEATYLGRAAITNARVLGFDPYVDKDAMMCLTLHLKQTRTSADVTVPGAAADASARVIPHQHGAQAASGEVYVASLKILFLGSNVEALSKVLDKQPEGVWPLFRQSFGGCCRTCVAIFVDRNDPGVHAQRILKMADTLREYENSAPRSGSVRKFLQSMQQSGGDDDVSMQDSVSMTRFREDAEDLLQKPGTAPVFYPLPGTRGRVRKMGSGVSGKSGGDHGPYERASRVIVLKPAVALTAVEEQPPVALASPPQRLLSPPEIVGQRPAVETVVVPAQPRQVIVENSPRKTRGNPDEGVEDVHVDMPHSVRIREHDARRMESTRRKLQQANAEKWPTLRLADSIRSGDAEEAVTDTAERRRTTLPSVATRLREEWENSKHYGSQKALPDPDTPFRTVVLVFNSEGKSGSVKGIQAADPGDGAVITRTDDTHVLLTMPPQPPSQECVKCRFQVDEVRAASDDVDATVGLMLSFSSLERLQEAFTVKQLNAAVLVTDITGYIQPFRSQPVWAAFHSTLHNVVQLRQRNASFDSDSLPFKVTLFGSVLRGKKLLRDLVQPLCSDDRSQDASALAVNRSTGSDGGSGAARIGVSPIFGALLYETRGIDVDDPSVVASYLASILQLADDVASDDPDAYLVLTCVQQTAQRLSPSELSASEVEQGRFYDARFSSYTLISTRSRVDMFEQGLQGNPTNYPIALFADTLVGKLKTVCVLTVDQDQADPDCVMRAMLMQHKAKTLATTRYQIRKDISDSGVPRSPSQSPRTLAHRHNSVRAYIAECESAARTLRERLAESSNKLTEADRAELERKADTYEQLAQQHMVYLTEPCGYELLTYRAVSPGVSPSVNASQLAEPVGASTPNSRSATPGVTRYAVTEQQAGPAAARALEDPPSPHSTKRSLPQTATPGAVGPFGPARGLAPADLDQPPTSVSALVPRHSVSHSPESLPSPDGSSRPPPTKMGSLASTKAPSTRDSVDGMSSSAIGADRVPRSLLTSPPTAESKSRAAVMAGTTPNEPQMSSDSSLKGPQLTPQRLPAEAGLTSRSIVLLATDAALMKMLRRRNERDTADATSDAGHDITVSETAHRGELILTSDCHTTSPVPQEFKFDDVICLSAASDAATPSNLTEADTNAGTAMPPSIPTGVNPTNLFKSSVLVAGLQGFLAGSNVSIVLQETVEAARTTLAEQLLRMVVSVCTRERPHEATLFLSASFVKGDQSVDLLADQQVPAAAPLAMSFSPLAGPFVSSSAMRAVWTPQDGLNMVTKALRVEKAVATTQREHVLVLTVWQKLIVEAEGDVSLSSITIVAGRGSPTVLRSYLKNTASPLKVLLRYVLGGPCYTICGSCITDAEQDASELGEKNTVLSMLTYQTSQLCNVAGRPVVCNSYRDLLRYHKTQLKKNASEAATLTEEINALEQKAKTEGASAAIQESLAKRKKKLATLALQSQRFTDMMHDETNVLKVVASGPTKEQQSAIPPYYSAMPS